MARSAEALNRRALKRNRTEDEQRRVDGDDMQKRLEAEAKRRKMESGSAEPQQQQQQDHPGLQEEGAWTCTGCGNRNFASRHSCRSKTCTEMRPAGSFVPPPWRPAFSTRHDPRTSKQLVWAKGANKDQIARNHELRRMFLETDGEGMSEDDVNRAKILIARDERKKQKKSKAVENDVNLNADIVVAEPKNAEIKTDVAVAEPKSAEKQVHINLTKQNKFLRKRYLKCGGTGMSEEEITRAKILIARDERKKLKRLELQTLASKAEPKDDKVESKAETEDDNVEAEDGVGEEEGKTKDKKKDRRLRKLYLKEGGVGMSEEDIATAKALVAKAERKKAKKALKKLKTTDGVS